MSYFDYKDGNDVFEGYLAKKGATGKPRPYVLVAHAWSGPGEPFERLAEELSLQGFTVIAIDVYGKGIRGDVAGDNSHLMNPLIEDRDLLRQRLLAAFKMAQNHKLVIPEKVAIVGHCFGGLCSLDLARANPSGLRGAVSIHGLLHAPKTAPIGNMDSSVLVLHGWEDPHVPPGDVLEFAKEMTAANADWQVHCYGNAMRCTHFRSLVRIFRTWESNMISVPMKGHKMPHSLF